MTLLKFRLLNNDSSPGKQHVYINPNYIAAVEPFNYNRSKIHLSRGAIFDVDGKAEDNQLMIHQNSV